jgi:hypothetical protein
VWAHVEEEQETCAECNMFSVEAIRTQRT